MQWLQQCRGFADPVGQRRAIQINAFAVEDLALPIQRQVIGVFVDQHMSKKARTWAPTLYRARGQQCLGEAIAAGTGEARAHDPVHDEVARNVCKRPASLPCRG